MRHRKRTVWALTCIAVAVSGEAGAGRTEAEGGPAVTAPPESFFEKVREGDREAARAFYAKYLDIDGIPVAAAALIADEALHRTHEIVSHMLAGRPDIRDAMVERRMYLIIIGRDQLYTDMPEYRNRRNPEYLNERVRGTGGNPTSFGEENLLSLPIDRYDDESIAVHEFSHTIDSALRSVDPEWRERRSSAYRRAMEKGLWRHAYAASNPGEYWAEICQSYFDSNRVNNWNHGPIRTREQLKLYDPEGYELVRTTFRLRPEQDWRYTWMRTLPNASPPPERFGIDPYYTKFTWARELTVVGRQASDDALLAANDTVRKLFAYRHDILKALIADGVRLVVLGRGEKLSDLPELAGRNASELDPTARFLDYSRETKLLAVAEENVLGDPRDPDVGRNQLLRVLARAIYHVTGTRPVDPEWETRSPRQRQQYELRVQRMDVRFDEKLAELYDAAMARGAWKGTAAAAGRIAYWAEGLVAYFDATGGETAPEDAPRPIATREMLAAYDPDLHALIEETVAYTGQVDWRYDR